MKPTFALFRAARRSAALWAVPAVLLTGCATEPPIDADAYRQRVTRTLAYQKGITFSDEQTYPGQVLCGRFSGFAGDGFAEVTDNFIVTPYRVVRRPSALEKAVYCSDDPLRSLSQAYDVEIDSDGIGRLNKIVADMRAIDTAVFDFQRNTTMMPMSLDALRESGSITVDELLLDPWGYRYEYVEELTGRTTPRYKLRTLGDDNKPGGSGWARDINKEEVPTIRHALRINEPS